LAPGKSFEWHQFTRREEELLSKQVSLLTPFFFEAGQYHHFGIPAQLRRRPPPVDMFDGDS
jgi:hypothetical protein